MLKNRDFLEVAWQHGMFTDGILRLVDGTAIEVVKAGYRSDGMPDQMPEFSGAAVRLVDSGITLHGSVKIDINSSDWRNKGTVNTSVFDNVILHFVLNPDRPIIKDSRGIPTLAAAIPEYMLDRVRTLAAECKSYFTEIDDVYRENMFSRLMTDRVARKSAEMLAMFHSVDDKWPRMAMVAMMRHMGYGASKDYYEQLARSVPDYVIINELEDTQALEALLLGQGGYFEEPMRYDEYSFSLHERYAQQRAKYNLHPLTPLVNRDSRPQSSPQLMLARIAAIITGQRTLFERVIQNRAMIDIRQVFRAELSPYWQTHNALGRPCAKGITTITEDKIDLILLNFVLPFWCAYGDYTKQYDLKDHAQDCYTLLPAENNRPVRDWSSAEYRPQNAYYSQALIQLRDEYCAKSRCVTCPLGSFLLLDYYKRYKKATL